MSVLEAYIHAWPQTLQYLYSNVYLNFIYNQNGGILQECKTSKERKYKRKSIDTVEDGTDQKGKNETN